MHRPSRRIVGEADPYPDGWPMAGMHACLRRADKQDLPIATKDDSDIGR